MEPSARCMFPYKEFCMNDLRLLFRYGKPYRRDLWAAAGLIFVECIFEMVIPVLMSTLVDEGVPSHDMGIILRQG